MSPVNLNPLLQYSQHDIEPGHCSHILWDLREPPFQNARHVSALDVPLSNLELDQHATSPPITHLHVTCDIFPGLWPIKVQNLQGVNILDVLNAIYTTLQTQLTHEEWDHLSAKQRDRIGRVFDARWRISMDPAEVHSHGVLRVDCLLKHTWFGGLSASLDDDESCILTLRRPK